MILVRIAASGRRPASAALSAWRIAYGLIQQTALGLQHCALHPQCGGEFAPITVEQRCDPPIVLAISAVSVGALRRRVRQNSFALYPRIAIPAATIPLLQSSRLTLGRSQAEILRPTDRDHRASFLLCR